MTRTRDMCAARAAEGKCWRRAHHPAFDQRDGGKRKKGIVPEGPADLLSVETATATVQDRLRLLKRAGVFICAHLMSSGDFDISIAGGCGLTACGNAGTQTLTVVVRGLALGIVSEANARTVLMKELMVGALNGLLWAITVAIVTVLWFQNYLVALALSLAMVINLAFAALSGVIIPVLVRKIGVDPAVASGVILTTVTDVVGFFAFLGLATLFLL